MNKSLLALLQKEYSLVRNIYVNEEIYETYRNEDKHRASEFMKKSEESKKALLECQKEISQYLVFFGGIKRKLNCISKVDWRKIMNEEMDRIKDYFKEYRCVSLAKQCKQEYIVYSYFSNNDGTAIIRLNKQHFKNRDLEGGKSKIRKVEIPIRKFFDDIIYDLLIRGYRLEDWN